MFAHTIKAMQQKSRPIMQPISMQPISMMPMQDSTPVDLDEQAKELVNKLKELSHFEEAVLPIAADLEELDETTEEETKLRRHNTSHLIELRETVDKKKVKFGEFNPTVHIIIPPEIETHIETQETSETTTPKPKPKPKIVKPKAVKAIKPKTDELDTSMKPKPKPVRAIKAKPKASDSDCALSFAA